MGVRPSSKDGGDAEIQNARFRQECRRARRACVQATRAIRTGEEIYASYGVGGLRPHALWGACAPHALWGLRPARPLEVT